MVCHSRCMISLYLNIRKDHTYETAKISLRLRPQLHLGPGSDHRQHAFAGWSAAPDSLDHQDDGWSDYRHVWKSVHTR